MTMLQQAGLKLEFWAKTFQTTVYLVNLSLPKAIRFEVPQALWSGKQPTYDRLHIFGCEAYTFTKGVIMEMMLPNTNMALI